MTSRDPEWIVSGGGIAVRYNDKIMPVSASDVVRAEFKQKFTAGLPPRRPSQDLGGMKLHRFPLEPCLCVQVSAQSGARASLLFGSAFEVDSFPDRDDQIVRGDEWYPLDDAALNDIRQMLAAASVDSLGALSLRAYVALARTGSRLLTIELADESVESVRDRPSASKLTATLYPYQETGFRWLAYITNQSLGCVVADEMGLGKTVQVIALLCAELDAGRRPSVVVAPATVLENWRREFAKFSPSVSVRLHQGAERTGFPAELSSCDVVVTSYDTLVRDLSLFRMVEWNVLVLDEAQAIKNPDTARSKSVRRVRRRIGIAVTGTPFENHVTDLWSILDFAIPGVLGDLADFRRCYDDSMTSAGMLERIISPMMLRRRVRDVAADLPPRIDIPEPIVLDEPSAAEYDQLRAAAVGAGGSGFASLAQLRMFCAHPFLVRHGAAGDPAASSTKYERLTQILEQILELREKALIFTSFTAMIDILCLDLTNRFGVPVTFIDGRVPVQDRQPIVDSLADAGPAILVLNPKAAGVGLNITAANHVIHYNLEWNPAVEDQATARAHRRGQPLPVAVHRLFHVDTVEEVIEDRLMRKRSLSEAAVVGTEGESLEMLDLARALRISPID